MHLASNIFEQLAEPTGSMTTLCVNIRFFDLDGRDISVLDAHEVDGRQVPQLLIRQG